MPAEANKHAESDPGLITLVILLRLNGLAVETEYVTERWGTPTIGIAEMLRCAKQLGLKPRLRLTDWSGVARMPLPGVAALRDGGFLVLGRIVKDTVLVQHPLSSQSQLITRAELEAVWDGRVLLMNRRSSWSDRGHRLFRFFTGTRMYHLVQHTDASLTAPALKTAAANYSQSHGHGKTRLLSNGRALPWIVGALALIAVASLSGSLGRYLTSGLLSARPAVEQRVDQNGTSNPAVPVVAATVERQDVPIYLFGLGTVQAFRTVRVTSRVDGQLQKLAFKEGQDVRVGEVLAQIDPLPFEAALRQMEANLRRDEAQLRNAKAELERTLSLAAREYASRQNVDIRRSTVEQLEAAIEADQAQIESAKIQLEYTLIRAPMNGRTGLRLIDEGNMIRASDPTGIVVLTQLQPIEVIFALPEEDLPKINARLSAGDSLAVTAFGRDGKTVLADGVLATIDNVIDRKTGTFKLKAHFANERNTLWPGQFINARIHLATRRNGIIVSEAAVQRGPDGPYVFVIESNNEVAMRAIKVAQTESGTALIDDGLMPGQRVVTEGQHRLQQGSRVLEVKPE